MITGGWYGMPNKNWEKAGEESAGELLAAFSGHDNKEYLNPDFSNYRRVHDWKNHVGDNTKGIWHTFTKDQQLALYLDAEKRSDNEDWD